MSKNSQNIRQNSFRNKPSDGGKGLNMFYFCQWLPIQNDFINDKTVNQTFLENPLDRLMA